MAIHWLVALLALALLRAWPRLGNWRGDKLFRYWVAQLSDLGGGARVALALVPPLVLCAAIWLALNALGGPWLAAWFALIVLIYALGPRDFDVAMDAVAHAADDLERQAAAQALADDGQSMTWDARTLSATVAYAALRRRFGALCWFFLLGPVGALGYRLTQTLARDATLVDDTDPAASHVANAADWLPAQLLTFTLALVGNWDAVIGAWRRWRSQAAATSWYAAGPDFLGAAAQAEVVTEIDGGDGYSEEHSDPLAEVQRLRATLLRALLAWLGAVALIVIGAWLG